MIIRRIVLNNFRNYGRLDIEVGPSVNVIYGNNAQGKTNIIEAISVGSSVMSHRTSKDKEMIKFGEQEYIIDIYCHDEVYDSDMELKVSYMTERSTYNDKKIPRRQLIQDGMIIPKLSQYMGVCNTVIFAPEDLSIVKGAPTSRRKYLNLLICKVSPSYYDMLGRTRRIIDQKNACIKTFKGRWDSSRENELEYWDFSLAELSADLIMERFRYCGLIDRKASSHHSVISDGKEQLKVEYSTITGVEGVIRGILDTDDMFDQFVDGTLSEAILTRIKKSLTDYMLSKLRSERVTDVERGIYANGVHRDDLDISLNGLSMRQFSSQGQQRSAALALKLAELEIISERTNSAPILLLDDVFSELDEGRRISLLSGMNLAQIFITCTDRKFVENELSGFITNDSGIRFYRVDSGEVFYE
ncbi:MAG: DNA replication and repair protein RecF [Clostridiales bacterium]|nr:DNA replication and repair protein RecF [Clostridiales bacterium]